jgi:dihydrodipicolinate synthase/N-acetylneuraminate lyase
MTPSPLGGVLAVVQTPFTEDDAIDPRAFADQVDWLYENGADGIVVGMVSEILRLSTNERRHLVELTCESGRGRGPVVVSVGAESTSVAASLARHARDAGATAVMATPPALSPTSDEALFEYFATIAEVAEIPVVVQDASNYVGSSLTIELQARLFSELGDRILFKPESNPVGPRVTRLLQATGGAARVFEGSGGLYLVDSFRRGAIGTMPAGDLVWALSVLWQSLVSGDFARAYRIAGPLSMLISLQGTLDSYVAVEKYILHKQGVFPSNRMRGPVADHIDEGTLTEVDRLLALLHEAVTDA